MNPFFWGKIWISYLTESYIFIFCWKKYGIKFLGGKLWIYFWPTICEFLIFEENYGFAFYWRNYGIKFFARKWIHFWQKSYFIIYLIQPPDFIRIIIISYKIYKNKKEKSIIF